jgi:hypothetical protein
MPDEPYVPPTKQWMYTCSNCRHWKQLPSTLPNVGTCEMQIVSLTPLLVRDFDIPIGDPADTDAPVPYHHSSPVHVSYLITRGEHRCLSHEGPDNV